MVEQRNSNCWYLNVCNEECSGCITYLELKWQMDNSGLPVILQKPIELFITDDNACDKKAFNTLASIRKNIVEEVENGLNLYICGRAGNGKTSWAIKILQTYLHYMASGNYENLKGMFVSVADLLLRLKDFSNPPSKTYKDCLEQVDLVVWDDVAIAGISQYDYTQLYTLINNRILAGKANIFTSNITDKKDLEEIFGERLTSRIYGTSEIIQLKGSDMR